MARSGEPSRGSGAIGAAVLATGQQILGCGMDSVGLLNLVSRSNAWLSERHNAIARNVANVNTPGYRAVDVPTFSDALGAAGGELVRSHPAHIATGQGVAVVAQSESEEGGEATYSGNTVSLEKEMLKAGEVSGKFALGTSVYKSFHRMIISSAR
jgi:flagellar basal-body rod protein FlgB